MMNFLYELLDEIDDGDRAQQNEQETVQALLQEYDDLRQQLNTQFRIAQNMRNKISILHYPAAAAGNWSESSDDEDDYDRGVRLERYQGNQERAEKKIDEIMKEMKVVKNGLRVYGINLGIHGEELEPAHV